MGNIVALQYPEDDEYHQDDDVSRSEEFKNLLAAKFAVRAANLKPERLDNRALAALNSNVKRTAAVIRKLKHFNEQQLESLMDELRGVNLTMYISEVVAAVCDANLKGSDIHAAAKVCSLLHQQYAQFMLELFNRITNVYFSVLRIDFTKERKPPTLGLKKRVAFKLLQELFVDGAIDVDFFSILFDLCNKEYLRYRETSVTNISLLNSFVRQMPYLAGLPKSGEEDVVAAIFPQRFKERSMALNKSIRDCYLEACRRLHIEHTSMCKAYCEENASSYEESQKFFDQLYRAVSALAEAMHLAEYMQPPVFPSEALWDDEDSKSFYEALPDLRESVPAVLLGGTDKKGSEQSLSKAQDQPTDSVPETQQGQAAAHDTADASVKPDCKSEKQKKEKGKEKVCEIEKEKLRGPKETNLDGLLQRLPGCVSRDLIDQLTVEFCYLNSKSSRKKLATTLFNGPRTSLKLLPYYSRMVATLSRFMIDVHSILLQLLKDEFYSLFKKKDETNIESKIRNIRFIGELCKFKLAPAGFIFSCLKACLDDFTHHNIDVACKLLETCGRYLYLHPYTNGQMKKMLATLMRLNNVKNLNPDHTTLVKNAYDLCILPKQTQNGDGMEIMNLLLLHFVSCLLIGRVNIFGWRLARDRLTTAMNLTNHRVPIPSNSCKMCEQVNEDANHLVVGWTTS